MRIAVVDDEIRWQEKVREILVAFPWGEQVTVDAFSEGEDFCGAGAYDVVFLDIEMEGMDGFETAELCKKQTPETIIIFLTTHTELSRRGYMVSAFRYLDKGNIHVELKEALKSVADLWNRNYALRFHMLHVGEIQIPIKDVNYIETLKRNVLIHTTNGNYLSNSTIEELEEELKERWFARSHKSYLVNLANIDNVGKEHIFFENGDSARLTARKYSEVVRKQMEYQFRFANG